MAHVIAPQKGAQEIAMQSQADVIIYGGAAGAGKSHLLLMHPLQYIRDPNFNAIYFRRVTRQLTGAGGLWMESKKMYRPFKTKVREKDLQHVFPNGATVTYAHMEHEKNCEDHQGLQYSAVYFDELTHFTERQFTYLLSRLRSEAKNKSYCMASCNPDADSWVLKWIQWFLDADGYPDPTKKGKLRYYVTIEDSPVFGDTPEELKEKYPDFCKVYDPDSDTWIPIEPKSFTFIGGTIFDNPFLIRANPNYLAELNSLPKVERARLLEGNWYARPEGANYANRGQFKKAATLPLDGKMVRAWDKASAEPSDVNRYPDYTASIGMLKTPDGFYYLFGNYHEDMHDDNSEVFGRFRKRPGERDALIAKQGHYDGSDVTIILPQDPGAAGQTEAQNAVRLLLEEGLIAKTDPTPNTKSKLTKFTPFASALENGLVYIVESTFPNQLTLEAIYKELESFDGERSTGTKKDDFCDTISTAFNFLCQKRVIKTPRIPNINAPTVRVQHMARQSA